MGALSLSLAYAVAVPCNRQAASGPCMRLPFPPLPSAGAVVAALTFPPDGSHPKFPEARVSAAGHLWPPPGMGSLSVQQCRVQLLSCSESLLLGTAR